MENNLQLELIASLGAALLLGLVLTPGMIMIARKLKIFDYPGGRKIHRKPVAVLGGLSIYLAFFLVISFFFFWNPRLAAELTHNKFLGLYLGSSIILILGVFDDLYGSGARLKFIVQGIAATILFYFGFRITFLTDPMGGAPVEFDMFTSFLLTIFWVAAMTNAINLLDGLDGLASGVSAVAGTTLIVVALARGDVISAFINTALVGALLGFLPYNIFPARIFLGDTGSLLIGFILAATGMLSLNKALTTVALIIPVAALVIPVYDTTVAIIRRGRRGKNIFKADTEHIHHLLLKAGLTQRQVMLLLCFTSVYFGLLAYLCILLPEERFSWMIIGIFSISVVIAIRLMRRVEIHVTLKRKKIRLADDDFDDGGRVAADDTVGYRDDV